jgi:predicted DNA-binding protein
MKKDLTAVRLRPEQVEQLKKLAGRDKETSVSSLIRRAVDEFILRAKKK